MSLNEKKAGFNTITLHFMAFIVLIVKNGFILENNFLRICFKKEKYLSKKPKNTFHNWLL